MQGYVVQTFERSPANPNMVPGLLGSTKRRSLRIPAAATYNSRGVKQELTRPVVGILVTLPAQGMRTRIMVDPKTVTEEDATKYGWLKMDGLKGAQNLPPRGPSGHC